MITSVEQKEKSKSNEEQYKYAKEYCGKVEGELDKISNTILHQKMKADHYWYIAEFRGSGDKKKQRTK